MNTRKHITAKHKISIDFLNSEEREKEFTAEEIVEARYIFTRIYNKLVNRTLKGSKMVYESKTIALENCHETFHVERCFEQCLNDRTPLGERTAIYITKQKIDEFNKITDYKKRLEAKKAKLPTLAELKRRAQSQITNKIKRREHLRVMDRNIELLTDSILSFYVIPVYHNNALQDTNSKRHPIVHYIKNYDIKDIRAHRVTTEHEKGRSSKQKTFTVTRMYNKCMFKQFVYDVKALARDYNMVRRVWLNENNERTLTQTEENKLLVKAINHGSLILTEYAREGKPAVSSIIEDGIKEFKEKVEESQKDKKDNIDKKTLEPVDKGSSSVLTKTKGKIHNFYNIDSDTYSKVVIQEIDQLLLESKEHDEYKYELIKKLREQHKNATEDYERGHITALELATKNKIIRDQAETLASIEKLKVNTALDRYNIVATINEKTTRMQLNREEIKMKKLDAEIKLQTINIKKPIETEALLEETRQAAMPNNDNIDDKHLAILEQKSMQG